MISYRAVTPRALALSLSAPASHARVILSFQRPTLQQLTAHQWVPYSHFEWFSLFQFKFLKRRLLKRLLAHPTSLAEQLCQLKMPTKAYEHQGSVAILVRLVLVGPRLAEQLRHLKVFVCLFVYLFGCFYQLCSFLFMFIMLSYFANCCLAAPPQGARTRKPASGPCRPPRSPCPCRTPPRRAAAPPNNKLISILNSRSNNDNFLYYYLVYLIIVVW